MKNYIQITIATSLETYKQEFGRDFLNKWIESEPRLVPEFFDPLVGHRNTTPFVNVETVLQQWGNVQTLTAYDGSKVDSHQESQWKRKSTPQYKCHTAHQMVNIYGDISTGTFYIEAKYRNDIEWLRFFHELCNVSQSCAAMLHHFTSAEYDRGTNSFVLGSLARGIDPKFQDISWAMVVGDVFPEPIDPIGIRAKGFHVEEMGYAYLILVTDRLSDVSERYDYFCERREILRSLLPASLFVDREKEEREQQEFMAMFLEHKGIKGGGGS